MKKALIIIICVVGIILGGCAASYYFFPGIIVKSFFIYNRLSAGLSRHEIKVDDHQWAYFAGVTGDVIVFLNGFGDSKEGWGAFPAPFMDSYRVIIPDLPGFGENSRVLSDSYRVPDQAKRLDRFVETIGLRSFHLCGESLGGTIAAYYATVYPDKVKSIMVMGSPGLRQAAKTDAMRAYEKDKTEGLYYKTEKGFHQLMGWAFAKPPQFPRPFVDYFVETARERYSFNKKMFDDLYKTDFTIMENRLLKITAPVLIIWGNNDRIIHISTGEAYHKGIKNSRLEILNGGHMIYADEPEKTIKVYRDFLKNLK